MSVTERLGRPTLVHRNDVRDHSKPLYPDECLLRKLRWFKQFQAPTFTE